MPIRNRAWLSHAVQQAAKLAAGRAAVREYEAETGAFTQEEIDRADEILDELGVWPERTGRPRPGSVPWSELKAELGL